MSFYWQALCQLVLTWVDSYVTKCLVDLCGAHVRAALKDMNAKCGNMKRAMNLFEEMPKRDLIPCCSAM